MDTFGPRVVNPKVIRMGRRYSLVHRPGLYLINDTKDPNAPGELFPVGERSQALRRYRQLESHSMTARLQRALGRTGTRVLQAGTSVRALSRRDRRGLLERVRIVGARSRVSARMVSGRRGRTLVPIVGVASFGVIATLLILVESMDPETGDPAFSLGVGEVAAPTLAVAGVATPTLAVGSGDPPRAELPTQVDEASVSGGVPDRAGHHDGAGRGDASVASDSGSPTGSSGAGSDSTTVQVAVSDGSGSDTSGSGSGGDTSGSGSGDSDPVEQDGGSSADSGGGPGGAGPGGGSGGGGDGGGSGGGGGGGG